ncbi:RHS repeat-associated core domain-containing protein [Marilutibacter maris]|uniref:RHS repeat-associated core domain-containing protein n=1 Tax=Marilutibacter maris TaxID=1605891 RepID=UPI001CB9BC6A|nr:RHS repeat-associated core domain-containing protein [Lysobacter maris]
MIYAQQRYYDEDIGRFLSVDPVAANPNTGASFNRYVYANNNPYRFTDPDGRQSRGNVQLPSTGVPLFDWLMTPSDARGSFGQMMAQQFGVELSQPHSVEDVVLYIAIAMSAGTGAAGGVRGLGAGCLVSTEKRLADGALVVRGGSTAGANSAEGLAKGIGTHPAGVTGFSAESANGASLCQLCTNVQHNQVGVTTVGQVRAAGGDVISTGGRSPNHATVTGLAPEKAAELMAVQPNPVPAAERAKF